MVDNVDSDSGIIPGVSTNDEEFSNDSCRTSVIDTTITLTTSAVELKVGGAMLSGRKYLIMQARASNIRWGFNTTCNFDLFKNEKIIIPVGVAVYGKTTTGSSVIVIAEGS